MQNGENETQNQPENETVLDGGFVSDYEDNKDSSPSEPITLDGGVISPGDDVAKEDDSAEPRDADVQHLATPEDVEASE